MAINVTESKSVVKKFIGKNKPPFPILLDGKGKVSTAYNIRSHPAHFLINGVGELIGFSAGALDWNSEKPRDLIRYLIEMNQ